jgi:mono/diheme cytochrome c family protein
VNQHCGVCHTKPDLNAAQFGPSLDKTLLGSASEADIRKFIAVGAPDMPGFAITLNPTQITAIVEYIKEAPPAAATAHPAAPAPSGPAAAGDN